MRLPLLFPFCAIVACSSQGASPTSSTIASTPSPEASPSSEPDENGTRPPPGSLPPRRDAAAPPSVTDSNESMPFAGVTRTYILSTPTTYDPAKVYPLVLVFHGNPGTAAGMRATSPFDVASRDQAVIVYPQGLDNNWDLYKPLATNKDMPWIQALVDEVATKVNVDRTRVYGHGFSGGAFFAAQMACRVAGVFKAIAVHAGGGPEETQVTVARWPNGCVRCAGGPVPTFVAHGASDTTVVPESGAYTASCYATTNGCGRSLAATTGPCQRYEGCPQASPVELCMVPNLGHQMWSEGTAASWRFFQRF